MLGARVRDSRDFVTPARGTVTVQHIETPETAPHGRIVLTPETREALTSCQMVVVAVGAPSLCEEADCERAHQGEVYSLTDAPRLRLVQEHASTLQAGDWVVVRHRSLTATHEDGLYACHQDDVLAVLQQ